MRVLFLFSSILIAVLSIIFRDTLIATIELYSTHYFNTNTTTAFKGLPLIPPRALYGIPKSANMTIPRTIRKAFLAREQAEGAGARVRRSIGTPQLKNFSPFLMLDHFTIKPGAGFPDHPHRGQETITYLLEGAVDHEDFAGNAGTIEKGDLQFMTAGRGIMHAEMPAQNLDGSANVGMQLWVDLPEKLKKCEPRYRDLRASEIPNIDVDDGKVHIKVISGQSHGVDSVKELAYTPVWYFDIEIKPGGKVTQDLPVGWNAFAYTLSGSTDFGVGDDKTTVGEYHNVVFEQKGDVVVAEVAEDAKENGHFGKLFFNRYHPPSTSRDTLLGVEKRHTHPTHAVRKEAEFYPFIPAARLGPYLPRPKILVCLATSSLHINLKIKKTEKAKAKKVNAFAGNRTRGPSMLVRETLMATMDFTTKPQTLVA
jgi:redox-sensitive bicupin YhaK (pirin superfamily)